MFRFLIVVTLSVLLIACGQYEDAEIREVTMAKQQLAQANMAKQVAEKNAAIALASQKAAEVKAASSERLNYGMGIGALLAFAFGIGLGSSSRKVAAKAANE